MARDVKPNLWQLNLQLFTEVINLPQQKTAELRAALGDMLLNAITAVSETAMEVDNESEADS